MNLNIDTGKGVPSPFPAPVQTATATQNTTPQAGVAAKTIKPPQAAAPVQNAQPVNTQAQSISTHANIFTNASTYHYLTGNGFMNDIAFFNTYKDRKTGFANMDLIQPLLPGLYGIGAPPSNGKTTFSWQFANQQACMGEYVLYFAQEQTKSELVPKSLSHRFYMAYRADASQNNGQSILPRYTSIDIRYGNADIARVQSMAAAHALDIQDRLFVFDGGFSHTIDDIILCVESFIHQTGRTPVVILDYLQIIESPNSQRTLDSKDKIDQIVKKLKQLQLKHTMTIIVVSSLNRLNYTMPIELESFKESGSIEYTLDVVWGLELSILSDPNLPDIYDKTGKKLGKRSETEKRIMLSQAKLDTPRSMKLKYIKNRFGAAGQSVLFDYYPAYETFLPR